MPQHRLRDERRLLLVRKRLGVSVQQRASRRLRLDAEKTGAGTSARYFFLRGLPDRLHSQVQTQRNAGQRVVAVQHDMVGINFGHGVQDIAWRVGVASLRQRHAIEGHALLCFCGEQSAGLQKQQLIVEIAKSVLGFEVQRHAGTGAVALQRFFDAGQQIVAPHQKLYGFIQHVKFLAKRVLECPGQCDHTLLGNFHRRIVAA